MKRDEATNTFTNGLVKDLNPISTPNTVVTDALNATLLTYNGNENVLQNDMGNGRVETAYLPEGYVPLGTAELGGIIYIVSYNPLIHKCLIGSFPSPERNVTTDELGESNKSIQVSEFYSTTNDNISNSIKSPYIKLLLTDKELNPGDKYLISISDDKPNVSYLSAYGLVSQFNPDLLPRYLKFNIVSVSDSGKLNILNDSLVWQPVEIVDKITKYYYLKTGSITNNSGEIDIDEYRQLINSNYNVFNSKTSGKLGILAELECIDTFEVAWDAICTETNSTYKTWNFYLFVNWSYNNTSSPDKINLYGIHYDLTERWKDKEENGDKVINNYPILNNGLISTESTDIMDYQYISDDNYTINFLTPYYVDDVESEVNYANNGGITTPRYNDGTDNLFLITDPIEYKYELPNDKNEDHSIILSITPTMPFGRLEWLTKEFTINIDKLGSGEINLVEYRYYIESNTYTLNWGLEAYPERNKKINLVIFTFYELDENIVSWIIKLGGKLDNDRVIPSEKQGLVWENANTIPNFTFSNHTYKITINNRSSYSGHFTEEISSDSLPKNKAYLVTIDIDYNGEKTITYYRIFYTFPIFNNLYYNEKDFSALLLEDALNLQFTVSNTTINNLETSYTITDEEGNLIDHIPLYIRKTDGDTTDYTTTFIKYKIVNNASAEVRFLINCNDTNAGDGFSIINTFTEQTDKRDYTPTNNAEFESVSNTSINSSSYQQEGNEGIDLKPELGEKVKTGGNYLLYNNYSQTLTIPFQILYNKETSKLVPYIIERINIGKSYLIYTGLENSHWIYLDNVYQNVEAKDSRDWYDDDTNILGSIGSYSRINSLLQNKLQSYDAVILVCKTHHSAIHGGEGCYTAWGKGVQKGDRKETYWTWWRASEAYSDSGQFPISGALICYAMLNTNGDVVLFTFKATNDTEDFMGLELVNSSRLLYTSESLSWNSNIPPLITCKSLGITLGSTTETANVTEKIEYPLLNYCKAREYNGALPVYEWGLLNYYNSFTNTTVYNLSYNVKTTIRVNSNVEINGVTPNNNIIDKENCTKNITYLANRETSVSVEIPIRVILDGIILNIITVDTSRNLVELPDGSKIELENISTRAIYTPKGKEINYLKSYTDGDEEDPDVVYEKDNSNISLQCTDNNVRIISDKTDSDNKVAAHFRQLEQSVAITNISLI